jgi:hypothetical protein
MQSILLIARTASITRRVWLHVRPREVRAARIVIVAMMLLLSASISHADMFQITFSGPVHYRVPVRSPRMGSASPVV